MKINFIVVAEGSSDLRLVEHIERILIDEGCEEVRGEAPDLGRFHPPVGTVQLSGADDFSNIGGFVNGEIFLCTSGGTPNVFADSTVIEITTNGTGSAILVGADFRCAPIRHFKFPDNKISPYIYNTQSLNHFQTVLYFL